MDNVPRIVLGLVAASRNVFPASLSLQRVKAVIECLEETSAEIKLLGGVLETELDAQRIIQQLREENINALVIYLGNFGPEGPVSLLADQFDGPVMICAASEEESDRLFTERGDAFCGLLNASYNLGLRNKRVYIPECPVGTPKGVAVMILEFISIARVFIGVRDLKIVTFGPRPENFFACNTPIKPLYDLGLCGIEENSELDLLLSFKSHTGDERIPEVAADMSRVFVPDDTMIGILPSLAQYELTLLDWARDHLGAAKSIAFANKCWPAFASEFGFLPCAVHGRLTQNLTPVACEVDVYGALSEFILACATLKPPVILDINNTVPIDMYKQKVFGKTDYPYQASDLFMGFHCGNASTCHLEKPQLTYHKILKGFIEPDAAPNKSRGTIEGNYPASNTTIFRIHGTADAQLQAYIAQGEVLPIDARSFGNIGVFGVPEMMRFYRHVLLEKQYPHHAGVAFEHVGKTIYAALRMLGVQSIDFNQKAGHLYPTENPFGRNEFC